ncbi:Os02g0142300, partial [Oryza sativa Japonica Group]
LSPPPAGPHHLAGAPHPFAAGEATPDPSVRTYADAMRENDLQKQKEQLLRDIAQKKKEEEKAKEKKALPEQQPVGAAIDGISRKMVMLLLLLDPRRRRPPPIGMLLMQLLGLGAGMPPLVVSGMRRRR